MNQPPNLRVFDPPAGGGRIESCGTCTHFGYGEAYDPAKARDQGPRQLICTKYNAEVSASQVCDDYRRDPSRS